MPLSALAAALIPAGIGLVGSFFGSRENRRAADRANEDRTPPELQNLRQQLAEYYSQEGMGPNPYGGQLSADINPMLLAALGGVMQNQNAGTGTLNSLLSRFGSPSGAMGWSPTSSFSNRVGREPVANQGRRTPDRPTRRQQPGNPQQQRSG